MSEKVIAKNCNVVTIRNEYSIITNDTSYYQELGYSIYNNVNVSLLDGVLVIENITYNDTKMNLYITNYILRNTLLEPQKKVL